MRVVCRILSIAMLLRLIFVAGFAGQAGCGYTVANIHHREHPELSHARLATGRRSEDVPNNLGALQTSAGGWDSCDDLVKAVLLELVDEARAVGGTDVVDIRFKGRFTWIPQPVCRWNLLLLGRKSVEVRGVAIRDSAAPASPSP